MTWRFYIMAFVVPFIVLVILHQFAFMEGVSLIVSNSIYFVLLIVFGSIEHYILKK